MLSVSQGQCVCASFVSLDVCLCLCVYMHEHTPTCMCYCFRGADIQDCDIVSVMDTYVPQITDARL